MTENKNLHKYDSIEAYNKILLLIVILVPVFVSILCLFLKSKALLILLCVACIFLCVLTWLAYYKIFLPWSEANNLEESE